MSGATLTWVKGALRAPREDAFVMAHVDQPLVATTIAALRQHAPFDEMEPAAVGFMAARLRLAYFPRGAAVAGPERGAADRLLILKQGVVRRSGAQLSGRADTMLGPGECFPIGALIGRRATVYGYRAEADCFCWELGAEDFHRLLQESPRFHAFCTNHLAVLVERTQRAMRLEAQEVLVDSAGMLAPLHSAAARPVWCAPDTPLHDVLRSMQQARIGSMVVADAAHKPVGIFTLPDVLERVAAPQADLSTPVSEVMTRDLVTLEDAATLADAAIAMARHGIRHVVVTRDGRLSGIVSERDLFALQRISLSRTSQRIRTAQSLQELVAHAEEVRSLARHLLAQGVAAEQLTAMVSALNDALAQRLIALTAERHRLPGRWCWLALGSEGRLEQTFATDQDNALIYSGDETAKSDLLRFADEVNRGLEACGFPLCLGGIMAGNPRWCLSVEEWRRVFHDWIQRPEPEALLNASIFFDFRPLAGDARLGGELRESVLAQAQASTPFWRTLAENALRIRPPLGMLRDFATDEPIDLKLYGALPFVEAARVLALAHGIAETSTAARLRAARDAGVLNPRDAAASVDAFHYVQALRLKRQALQGAGEPGDPNRIVIETLNAIDRRMLKEALRQAAMLQDLLRMSYR